MKVLQINTVCGQGSTGRIATDLYEIIVSSGNQCKIAYGRNEALLVPKKDVIKIGSDLDVKLHGIMTRLTDRQAFYSKKATKKFIEEVKEYDPDIIHLHNIHGYYLNIDLLFEYIRKNHKKVVWTLHDCWSFTGHCAHFDYARCDKWKIECRKCPQKKRYPKSFLLDNSKKNYIDKKRLFTSIEDMILITPSNWLAELVKESYLQKYPVKVIQNGIDLEKFIINSNNNENTKKMILGVASVWDERKGIDDFIKMAPYLSDDYQVTLVGLSKKQLEKLPANVRGIARTNSIEELAQLYSSADVFVNCTYEDNFPTTNLEALACGTPVITYDSGGSKECLDHTCGVVVEKGNVKELISVIQSVAVNKQFKQEDCIKRSKMFDKKHRYAEYMDVYASFIGK